MGHRTFEDAQGVEWQVWDTIPSKLVSTTLEGGWLTFLSTEEKRRLSPIPLYWASADDAELRRLLGQAKPVRDRTAERLAEEALEAHQRDSHGDEPHA
jgi:hypothetical protein